MRALLIVALLLYSLEAISMMCYMALDKYPRQRESVGLGHDTVVLITALALVGWIAYLLWA